MFPRFRRTIRLLPATLGLAAARRDGLFRRFSANPFLRDLARPLVRTAIFVVGLLLALEVLDATALVGAVLGTAGVVGLAVGFAFRDLVENYIASVLLSLRQPFAPNDYVKIDSHEGMVVRLTSRATVLMTLDGNHPRIPNAVVFKGVILNYSRNPLRRFDFQDLGDSNVVLGFYAWIDQRVSGLFKVRSEAIRLVKTAFDDAGVDMPEPIHRLRLEGDVARAAATERERPRE